MRERWLARREAAPGAARFRRWRRVFAAVLLAVSTAVEAAAAPSTARIAVLPAENLAGVLIPLVEIDRSVRDGLSARGISYLEQGDLDRFMERHRVRYTGGLAPELGRAFREETGSTAVLVVSVELDEESDTPRFALTGRLVSTGEDSRILWMDGAATTWDERPGFLSIRLIRDPVALRETTIGRLLDSLSRHLAGADLARRPEPQRRFRPQRVYRTPIPPTGPGRTLRVAVLPFTNGSPRRRAGDLLPVHLVRHLVGRDGVEVIEPGIIRQVLLQTRLIPEGGITYAQADILRLLLSVDLVLTGAVMDYADARGSDDGPVVDFTVRAIEPAGRRLAWASMSHHNGAEGAFFFERGKIRTAHALASEMALSIVDRMLPRTRFGDEATPAPDAREAGVSSTSGFRMISRDPEEVPRDGFPHRSG